MNDRLRTWEEAVVWLKSEPSHRSLVQSCFFDDPLLEAAKRFWQSTEWAAVRKFLPRENGRMIDIGAGRGISTFAFAQEGWQVTALEPDPSDVVGTGAIRKLCKEARLNVDIVETWGEELPFATGSFDLAYCRQTLHHARDLKQLCREIGRVLRVGGRFIATREHVISRRRDLHLFLDNHPLHRLYGGENAYLLKEYLEAIAGGSIRIDQILNPMQSNINLYPDTKNQVKDRLARKYGLRFSKFIPAFVLSLKGALMSNPGRPYSFVGTKM